MASFWSDQPIIFVVSVLAFLLLLLRHHYYSPEFQSRKWVAKGAGGLLIAAVIFVAAQPGPHISTCCCLPVGDSILLNARFYALLAAKRGRTYALAAIAVATYCSFFTAESRSSLRYVATCWSALRTIFIFGPFSPTVGAQVRQAEYCSNPATPPLR